MVKKTIWGSNHGYKILKGGYGWKRELGFVYVVYNKLSTFIAQAIWP